MQPDKAAPLMRALERMNKYLKVIAIWTVVLLALIVVLDLVTLIPALSSFYDEGIPRTLPPLTYMARFLIEAIVYSGIGVVSSLYIRKVENAGLFALTIGVSYVAYVQSNGALWYYMTAHSRAINEFFFTAPILAPVIFIVGASLLWKLFSRGNAENAL